MYKFYSIARPISIGTLPKVKRSIDKDSKVVNFDKRKYIPSIQKEAWGYIEYPVDIRDYDDIYGNEINISDYDLVMEGSAFYRKIRPGDIICSHGIKALVLEIFSQHYKESSYEIDIEFKDSNGKYRRWRNYLDGGNVEYLESDNLYTNLSDDSRKLLQDCYSELLLNYIGLDGRPIFFARSKKDSLIYHLYEGAMYRGFVDLESAELNNDSDMLFYDMLVSVFSDSEFDILLFPCPLSQGEPIIKKQGVGLRAYLKARYGVQFR